MRKLILLFVWVVLGCSTNSQKSSKNEIVKIFSLEEFDSFYRIHGIDVNKSDTIFIISWKEKLYEKYKIKHSKVLSPQMEIGNIYKFKLARKKIQVATMEQLGQFIIIEKDTLWRGNKEKTPPKYFISQNTVGLMFLE